MSPADYETPEGVAAEADKRRREGEEEGGRKVRRAWSAWQRAARAAHRRPALGRGLRWQHAARRFGSD